MISEPSPLDDPTWLAQHARFLRTLVHHLVQDDAQREDLEQETWLAALTHGNSAPGPVRRWLARVARNAARKAWRREDRRARHERAAPAPSVPPSPPDLSAQLEAAELLVRAVRALDEPYRGAVVRRYWQDQPPRRIAAELDVPVTTVKSWLKRALAKLRQELDREHEGDRGVWCAALTSAFDLPGAGAAALGTSLGAILMAAKVKVAIAAGVVLATSIAVIEVSRSSSGGDATGRSVAVPTSELQSSPVADASASLERTPRSPPATSEPAPAPWVVSGRVTDESAQPLAHAMVTFQAHDAPEPVHQDFITDADGRYRGPLEMLRERCATWSPVVRGSVRVAGVAHAAGHRPAWGKPHDPKAGPDAFSLSQLEEGKEVVDFVLKPGGLVRGRVLSRALEPVPGARVTLSAGDEKPRVFGTLEDGTYEGTVEKSGAYRVVAAAFDRGVAVREQVALDPAQDATLEDLVLSGAGTIEGVARYPGGRPIGELVVRAKPRGEVSAQPANPPGKDFGINLKLPSFDPAPSVQSDGLAHGETRTDAAGRFRLAGLAPSEYEITAPEALPGTQASVLATTGTSDLELIVERYRLTISVTDENATPLPSVEITATCSGGPKNSVLRARPEAPGIYHHLVEPRSRWYVSAILDGFAPAETIVDIADREYEKRIDLVMREPEPATGTARVYITEPDGTPVPRFRLSTHTGLTLAPVTWGQQHDSGERLPSLPTGRYFFSIDPGEPVFRGLGAGWYLPIRQFVDIQAEQETEVRVTAIAAGRVSVLLHVPVGEDAKLGKTVVVIRRPGQPDQAGGLWCLKDVPGAGAPWPEQAEQTYVSGKVLETGVYTVSVDVPGYRHAEAVATVVPRQIAPVEIWLTR